MAWLLQVPSDVQQVLRELYAASVVLSLSVKIFLRVLDTDPGEPRM